MAEPRPYRPSDYLSASGRELPWCEVVNLFGRVSEQDRYLARPHGTLPAGLRVRMRYDRPRWPYFDADGAVPVEVNSFGLRDDEFPIQKPPGEVRVLAVGDSFTYGWGVRGEQAWPQVLERWLAERLARPVQVANAGFAAGAATPDGYDRWVASDGLLLAPDLVIVGFCLNDMGEVPMLAYPIVPPEPVLGGWSRAVDAAWRELRQWRVQRSRADLAAIVERDPVHWQATQAGLLRLRDMLRDRGVPLLVVVFPMFSQLERDYPYARLHAMVREFGTASGIAVLDLASQFVGRDENALTVHPTDQHPNAIAHGEIAAAIGRHVECERLLAR